jgi:small subunit ribosomal protein S17
MTDENQNDETQDDTDAAQEPETTDAPEGVADVENLPVEDVPEGDAAEPETPEAPEAVAEEPGLDEPPGREPATEEPEEAPEAVGEEAAAEEPAAEAEPAEQAPAEEPAAEAPSDTAPAAEPEPAAQAAEPAPKRKKKRLPRALRRTRTKPVRERPAERKAITRLPKPVHERGRRQERQGRVVSAAADKTIVVRVDVAKVHPMYKKVIKRSTRLHAHDEENEAKVGDIVRIVETRPLSKLKRWRLQEIVEAAK